MRIRGITTPKHIARDMTKGPSQYSGDKRDYMRPRFERDERAHIAEGLADAREAADARWIDGYFDCAPEWEMRRMAEDMIDEAPAWDARWHAYRRLAFATGMDGREAEAVIEAILRERDDAEARGWDRSLATMLRDEAEREERAEAARDELVALIEQAPVAHAPGWNEAMYAA